MTSVAFGGRIREQCNKNKNLTTTPSQNHRQKVELMHTQGHYQRRCSQCSKPQSEHRLSQVSLSLPSPDLYASHQVPILALQYMLVAVVGCTEQQYFSLHRYRTSHGQFVHTRQGFRKQRELDLPCLRSLL